MVRIHKYMYQKPNGQIVPLFIIDISKFAGASYIMQNRMSDVGEFQTYCDIDILMNNGAAIETMNVEVPTEAEGINVMQWLFEKQEQYNESGLTAGGIYNALRRSEPAEVWAGRMGTAAPVRQIVPAMPAPNTDEEADTDF